MHATSNAGMAVSFGSLHDSRSAESTESVSGSLQRIHVVLKTYYRTRQQFGSEVTTHPETPKDTRSLVFHDDQSPTFIAACIGPGQNHPVRYVPAHVSLIRPSEPDSLTLAGTCHSTWQKDCWEAEARIIKMCMPASASGVSERC